MAHAPFLPRGSGGETDPVLIRSVPGWIEAVVRAQPARPAILEGSRVCSYAELWDLSGRVARGLRRQAAFRPGANVGLLGPNSLEFVVSFLAVLRAGGVVVPLNDRLPAEELGQQLDFVDAVGCVALGDRKPAISGTAPVWLIEDLSASTGSSSSACEADSRAIVLLTSGSTGSPKGVVHSHATFFLAALQVAMALPFSRDDVSLAFLPFFASIPEQIAPALLTGGAVNVLPGFDPERVAEESRRATCFDAVPTILSRLLTAGDVESLRRLRWISFASEPMPPSLLERWQDELPDVRTHQFYGMTEMLTISHAAPGLLARDRSTVGSPFPLSRVEVVGTDLSPLPVGEEGEVTCLNPARMTGYLNDPEASRAALTADGAMRTGDLGCFDEDGNLHLTGRLKDLIISGGMNVAPAEIEAVASRHPEVAGVAVVGIPDQRWGETPVVVAVAARDGGLTAEALLRHCRGLLIGFKRPSAAAIVDALPQTGIGKSAKGRLRDAILAGELEIVRAEQVEASQTARAE